MVPIPAGHAFATVSLFADLGTEKLDELAASSRVRHFGKGQVLCSEGDPGEELLVLETGRIRISRFSSNGQEIVLADVDGPAAVGELAVIDGAPRAATVTAESEIRVRYLHRRIVLNLLEREPAVAVAMLRSMAGMVRATNDRLSDVLSLDVPGRLAKWLLGHADNAGQVTLHQSQEDLARALGTTRVTTNRALRQFSRLGMIEMRDHAIIIRKPASLQSVSEG